MTKEIEAVFEQGVIRPLQPLELAEGTRLDLIVITHEQSQTNGEAAKILAEIAALPIEGSTDEFAGREHDSVRKGAVKRDLFAELSEGMEALADARRGKRILRTHSVESGPTRTSRELVSVSKNRLNPGSSEN